MLSVPPWAAALLQISDQERLQGAAGQAAEHEATLDGLAALHEAALEEVEVAWRTAMARAEARHQVILYYTFLE